MSQIEKKNQQTNNTINLIISSINYKNYTQEVFSLSD